MNLLIGSSLEFALAGKLHNVMMQKGQALQPGLSGHLCREQLFQLVGGDLESIFIPVNLIAK
jgi:hypothetical protein